MAKLSPEIIEKLKDAQSAEELIVLAKEYGVALEINDFYDAIKELVDHFHDEEFQELFSIEKLREELAGCIKVED